MNSKLLDDIGKWFGVTNLGVGREGGKKAKYS
jgi:hypothetical protein